MNVKLCLAVVLLGAIVNEISAVDLDAVCTDSNVCTTSHAECADDNGGKKCKCSSGFKMDGTNCVAKGLTESCTDNAECSNVANAECISNICGCSATYAPNKGVCNQVVTGVTCTTATDCTSIKNAECSNASTPLCVCKTGSIKNAGACTIGLGQPCTASVFCTTENATCTGADNAKTCKCSSGFKEESTKCVAIKILNETCTDSNECMTNAECVDNTGKKCQCSKGFKAVGTNCVAKGLTDSCTDKSDCSNVSNAECTASKCACADTFTPKKGACVIAVSKTPCTAGGKQCDSITNAECDTTSTVLKCTCKSGFTENINQCQEKSGAVSTTTFIGMVFFPLMVLLSDKLFM